MSRHYFGKRVNGELCRFRDSHDGQEFGTITQYGMPPGWVAWHFDDSENVENSERCRILRERPVLVVVGGNLVPLEVPAHGPIISDYPMADAIEWFAKDAADAGIEEWKHVNT